MNEFSEISHLLFSCSGNSFACQEVCDRLNMIIGKARHNADVPYPVANTERFGVFGSDWRVFVTHYGWTLNGKWYSDDRSASILHPYYIIHESVLIQRWVESLTEEQVRKLDAAKQWCRDGRVSRGCTFTSPQSHTRPSEDTIKAVEAITEKARQHTAREMEQALSHLLSPEQIESLPPKWLTGEVNPRVYAGRDLFAEIWDDDTQPPPNVIFFHGVEVRLCKHLEPDQCVVIDPKFLEPPELAILKMDYPMPERW